jgi:LCP family protein required for cell wall assembly
MKKLIALPILILILAACSTTQAITEPVASSTPAPPTASPTYTATISPTPTSTPWIYPTAEWNPIDYWPYEQPPMVEPIADAWQDGVEVFVLLGSDYETWRANLSTGTDNTDAFIILIVNHDPARISVISVPRDLYVFIPGYGLSRINTAYRHGGPEAVADTIRYNFGLPMHGYAYVRMSAFSNFIDTALGGIDVEVGNPLVDHCTDIYFDMLPGTYHMDGATALCYARVRMFDGGFRRQDRQREVLFALKARFLELAQDDPIGLTWEILQTYVNENRYTDVGFDDMARLIPIALDATFVEYQMDYGVGLTHFTHPTTGAWLLEPPPPECTYTLMMTATLGIPWDDLPQSFYEGKCGIEPE